MSRLPTLASLLAVLVRIIVASLDGQFRHPVFASM